MRKTKQKLILSMLLLSIIAPCAASALTMEISQKGSNDWGFSGSEYNTASANDCESDIGYTLTVTIEATDITDGLSLYLYMAEDSATDCGTDPSICELLAGAQSTSDLTFDVNVQDLFGDSCEESTVYLWVALLESEDQAFDEGAANWPENYALDISLDTSAPTEVATNLQGVSGAHKVEVNWDITDSEDVGGYVLVYWAGSSSDSDTDSEVDLEPGAGTGSTNAECEVAGGFAEGDEYDPSLITGKNTGAADSASTSSLIIEGLTNGVSYNFAVVSLDEAGNPSVFSEVMCVIPEETINFADAYENANGKGGGEFCFIATAAFGSYDHPVVKVLRVFRDNFLDKLPGGSLAIDTYYAIGPLMAIGVEANTSIRELLIQFLFIFAGLSMLLMWIGTGGVMLGVGGSIFIGLLAGLTVPRRRRI